MSRLSFVSREELLKNKHPVCVRDPDTGHYLSKRTHDKVSKMIWERESDARQALSQTWNQCVPRYFRDIRYVPDEYPRLKSMVEKVDDKILTWEEGREAWINSFEFIRIEIDLVSTVQSDHGRHLEKLKANRDFVAHAISSFEIQHGTSPKELLQGFLTELNAEIDEISHHA